MPGKLEFKLYMQLRVHCSAIEIIFLWLANQYTPEI